MWNTFIGIQILERDGYYSFYNMKNEKMTLKEASEVMGKPADTLGQLLLNMTFSKFLVQYAIKELSLPFVWNWKWVQSLPEETAGKIWEVVTKMMEVPITKLEQVTDEAKRQAVEIFTPYDSSIVWKQMNEL